MGLWVKLIYSKWGSEHMNSVVIYGYYGQKNTGDDYIMLSVINSVLKSKVRDIYVFVKENYSAKFSFPSNVHFLTLSKNKLIRQLQITFYACKCEIFIIGGGGLWPNDSTGKVLCNYMWVTISKFFKTRIVLYGIEVTEIRKDRTRTLWRKILKKVDWVTTRTQKSLNILSSIIEERDVLYYYPDITFALKDLDLEKYIAKIEIPEIDGDFILWALAMPWSLEELQNEHFKDRYNNLISTLIDVHHYIDRVFPDCKNILVPFLYPGDLVFFKDLIALGFDNVEIYQGGLAQIRPLFAKAKLAIDMRFHSVIFSMFEACPFVAISYSPKTTDTLQDNKLKCFTEFGIRESSYFYKEFDLNKDELLKLIDRASDSKERKVDRENLISEASKGEKKLISWLDS